MVVVVRRTLREGGMEEVTLAKDGLRFTVTVPTEVADSPTALALYEHMADVMRAETQRVQRITAPGEGF